MSIVDGIIKAPVSLEDVAKTLGVNSLDVGTLCTSDHINMWSRMKPVHIKNAITHARTGKWWQGTERHCGIKIPAATSYLQIPGKYTDDGKNGWEYEPPWGGAISPYRLEDFENYYHGARPLLSNFTVPEKVAQGHKLFGSCILGVTPNPGESKDSWGTITFDDIGNVPPVDLEDAVDENKLDSLESYFFGLIVVDSTGKIVGCSAGPHRASSGLAEYTATNVLRLGSTYTVYPYLSQRQQKPLEDPQAAASYTLPNVRPAQFKVVSPEESIGLVIFFKAEQHAGPTAPYITWTLKITVQNSMSVLASQIECRYNESGNLSLNEHRKNLGAFDVSSSSPYSNSGKFSPLDSSKSYHLNIYLRTNLGTFQRNGILPITDVDPDRPMLPWLPGDDQPIN